MVGKAKKIEYGDRYDLCNDVNVPGLYTTIYKVLVSAMQDPGTPAHTMLVFVGSIENDNVLKVLKKIENSKALTKSEQGVLHDAFGASWEQNLGLNVLKAMNSGREKLGEELLVWKLCTSRIEPDDNVLSVKQKILDGLGTEYSRSSYNDVYMWCRYSTSNSLGNVLKALRVLYYERKGYASLDEVVDFYKNLTGRDLDSTHGIPEDKLCTYDEASDLIVNYGFKSKILKRLKRALYPKSDDKVEEPKVSEKEVLKFYKRHTGRELADKKRSGNERKLTFNQAVDMLLKADLHVNEVVLRTPIGLKHTLDGTHIFPPVNPTDILDGMKWGVSDEEVLGNSVIIDWDMMNTIESYQPYQRIIHACIAEKSITSNKVIANLYFPKYDGVVSSKNDLGEAAAFTQKVHQVYDTSALNAFSHSCFVHFIQLRNESGKAVNDKVVDVDEIFHNFQEMSVDIPFMKKQSRVFGSLVKLHQSGLKDTSLVSELENWVKSDVYKRNPIHDSLIIKLKLDSGVVRNAPFASLTILSNGICDLKLRFGIDANANLRHIRTIIMNVNGILAKLDKNLATFDPNVLLMHSVKSTTKIIRLTVGATFQTNTEKVRDSGVVEELITSRYNRYFGIATSAADASGLSQLVYKKIDGYGSNESIAMFVARQSRLITANDEASLKYVKKKMQALYDLTPSQAEHFMSNWKGILKNALAISGSLATGMKQIQNLNIRLKSSPAAYKVVVDGATSISQYKRIGRLLKVLFHEASSVTASDTKKKTATRTKSRTSAPAPAPEAAGPMPDLNDEILALDELDFDVDVGAGLDVDFLIGNNEPRAEIEKVDNVEVVEEGEGEDEEVEEEADTKKRGSRQETQLLKDLTDADKELFVFSGDKSFAKTCQKASNRQPIIMTKEEVEKQKDKLSGYLNYGSTPELAKRNYYACPDVWCPKSRVAMTREQYLAGNKKCPDPTINEKPMLLFDKSYWKDARTGEYKKRLIGLLHAKYHPKRLCIPCCFKTDQLQKQIKVKSAKPGAPSISIDANGNANQQEYEYVCDQETAGNEKYVMKASNTPSETGRFAVLPESLNTLLKNTHCGSGNMTSNKTNCFLRQGVQLHGQSFFHVMALLMGNDKLQSYQDVIRAITHNMTIELFISLENGWLCKRFLTMVNPESIYDLRNFSKFRAWCHAQENKAKQQVVHANARLDMNQIHTRLGDSKYQPSTDTSNIVIRLFMLWKAHTMFLDYIRNESIAKTHELLIDLFNMQLPWLNTKGYNILVIEADTSDGRTGNVYLPCMQHAFRSHKPFVMLLKLQQYYEPIVHVKLTPHDMNIQTRFALGDFVQVQNLVKYIKKQCKVDVLQATREALDVVNAVDASGLHLHSCVVDYDFFVIGFCVDNPRLFIPLREPIGLSDVLHSLPTTSVIIFATDIENAFGRVKIEAKTAIDVCKKLSSHIETTPGYFEPDEVISNGDLLHLASHRNANGVDVIPLYSKKQVEKERLIYNKYVDDLYMLVARKKNDPRKIMVDRTRVLDGLYAGLWNEAVKIISMSRSMLKKILMARHHSNPLPLALKRRIIDAMLQTPQEVGPKRTVKGILKSRVHTEGEIALVNPDSFENKLCSNIGNKMECDRAAQCVWWVKTAKVAGQETVQGGVCRVNTPEDVYDALYIRLVNELLNPFVALKFRNVNSESRDANEVIILSEQDIRSNKIVQLVKDISKSDAWGFKRKDEITNAESIVDAYRELQNASLLHVKHEKVFNKIRNDNEIGIYTAVKKMFPGYVAYPMEGTEEAYTGLSLFNYMARVYNATQDMTRNKLMTGEGLKKLVIDKILSNFESDPVKTMRRLLYNQYLTKNRKLPDVADFMTMTDAKMLKDVIAKNGVSATKLRTLLESPNYYPSDYDVELMADAIRVVVVTLGNKSTRNVKTVWCRGAIEGARAVLVFRQWFSRETANNKSVYDVYDVVVDKNKKELLESYDFIAETWSYITKDAAKYVFKTSDLAGPAR